MADIPEHLVTVLGKRIGPGEVAGASEHIETLFPTIEDYFKKPEGVKPVSQPKTGPSDPSKMQDSGSRWVMEETPSPTKGSLPKSEIEMVGIPPSRSVSSTKHDFEIVDWPPSSSVSSKEPGFEMEDLPPSGRVSSTDPSRESMSAYPSLENLQTDSDALKGKATGSRPPRTW